MPSFKIQTKHFEDKWDLCKRNAIPNNLITIEAQMLPKSMKELCCWRLRRAVRNSDPKMLLIIMKSHEIKMLGLEMDRRLQTTVGSQNDWLGPLLSTANKIAIIIENQPKLVNRKDAVFNQKMPDQMHTVTSQRQKELVQSYTRITHRLFDLQSLLMV